MLKTIFPLSMRVLALVTMSTLLNIGASAQQPAQDGLEGRLRVAEVVRLEALRVPTSSRAERFHVEEPDQPRSAAWRDEAQQVDKAGVIPMPTGGFELTSRVIVRTERPGALRVLAASDGLVLEPLAGVSGYWVLRARSVREAALVARVLAGRQGLAEAYVDLTPPWTLRELPNDPRFPQQWHLKNDLDPLFDVNAEAAWNAGYTGAGVVIGIVELAWQHDHPDLLANYNAEASQEGGIESSHATKCAGVAAAVAYNELMGVGVAYGAQLSDQIYGSVADTAAALAYRNDLNDVKSNSWGPPDSAKIHYMPSVIRSAIEESIATGRGGLGEVFVWASGNGGENADRVDYDPHASSRFTIAVGAIGDADVRADYNETGSSMTVVAHSSGNVRTIGTTTSGSAWTWNFGGTSASSPLAAGVIAMMLEANPGLSWRDVQHVLIESARKNDPNHPEWVTNGAGYEVNYNYGFGAVDAGAAVTWAETWTNVPHELVVDSGTVVVDTAIPDNDADGVSVIASAGDNIRVESVELILNVQTPFVGDLQITLTGPSGTESLLAEQRDNDWQDDYVDYLFTSLRHWGEESAGDWTIHIADLSEGDLAYWTDYRLIIYGTPVCPGDLDQDGQIETDDLLLLLAAYGAGEDQAEFNPAADFDNTGRVDLADLAYLLTIYGESCP